MSIPAFGWKNKKGTSARSPSCKCGSWKQHWINITKKPWPTLCSVVNCDNIATDGAHIYHGVILNERIVPVCNSCNKDDETITLKAGTVVSSANQERCQAPNPLKIL